MIDEKKLIEEIEAEAKKDSILGLSRHIPIRAMKEMVDSQPKIDGWIPCKEGLPSEQLTLQELREMAGQPVYCLDVDGYGIVKCETKGQWKGVPFLIGAWHKNGIAVNFEYDIEKRNLKCYRIEQMAAMEKDIPKRPIKHEIGHEDKQGWSGYFASRFGKVE